MAREIGAVQPIKQAPYFAHAQFSDPATVLALPQPSDELPFLKASWHYARALAQITRGDLAAAKAEAKALADLSASDFSKLTAWAVPATEVVTIAREVADGRIAQAEGRPAEAIEAFRRAVEIQDRLPYMEPPYWYYPVRQSLAAAQLAAGRTDDAIQTFRDSLVRTPNNAYALYGLAEALKMAGMKDAADQADAKFKAAWAGPGTPESEDAVGAGAARRLGRSGPRGGRLVGGGVLQQEQGRDGAGLLVARQGAGARPGRAAGSVPCLVLQRLDRGILRVGVVGTALRGRFGGWNSSRLVRGHGRMHHRMLMRQLTAEPVLHALHGAEVGIVGRAGRTRRGACGAEGRQRGGSGLALGRGDHAIGKRAGRVLAHALLEEDVGGDPYVTQRRGLHQEVAGKLGQDAALLLLGHGVEGSVALGQRGEVGVGEKALDLGRGQAFETGYLGGREAHGELVAHAPGLGRGSGEGAVQALAGGVGGGGEHSRALAQARPCCKDFCPISWRLIPDLSQELEQVLGQGVDRCPRCPRPLPRSGGGAEEDREGATAPLRT